MASVSVSAGVATTAPIGSPAARPLANVSTSGVTPDRLRGAEGAAAPDAALDLVEEEHRAAVVADPAGGARGTRASSRARRRSPAPARRCTAATVSSTAALERGDVVERHLAAESGMPAPRAPPPRSGPVGARERRGRAAVPAAAHARRSSAARCALPRQVQRVLVRLRARVAEEHPPERIGTERGEPLRQLLAQRAAARRSSRRAAAPPARRWRAPRRGWQCPVEATAWPP